MLKLRGSVFAALLILLSLAPAKASAGGWPIYNWFWDNPDAWKPDYKLTYVRTHLAPGVPCKGTTVTFKYENPQTGDNVSSEGSSGSFTFTEDRYKYSKYNGQMIPDCNTYAKFYSANNALKTGIVEFITADGKVYTASFALNFHLPNPGNIDSEEKYPLPWEEDYAKKSPSPSAVPLPGAPEMIYPQNGQILDLEGAYMFKVKPVEGASGYLFGLFQDNTMVYENYRDTKTLSSNGEFALWESNPAHAKFHLGEVKVMIRALVNNQWTDAREITINLKSRKSTASATVLSKPSLQPVLAPTPPAIQPSQQVVVVKDSSASAALQQKIDELQKRLEESQQKQSALELQLNQIINWIKSIFPLFK